MQPAPPRPDPDLLARARRVVGQRLRERLRDRTKPLRNPSVFAGWLLSHLLANPHEIDAAEDADRARAALEAEEQAKRDAQAEAARVERERVKALRDELDRKEAERRSKLTPEERAAEDRRRAEAERLANLSPGDRAEERQRLRALRERRYRAAAGDVRATIDRELAARLEAVPNFRRTVMRQEVRDELIEKHAPEITVKPLTREALEDAQRRAHELAVKRCGPDLACLVPDAERRQLEQILDDEYGGARTPVESTNAGKETP